jgi:hypothetical protein
VRVYRIKSVPSNRGAEHPAAGALGCRCRVVVQFGVIPQERCAAARVSAVIPQERGAAARVSGSASRRGDARTPTPTAIPTRAPPAGSPLRDDTCKLTH